jgi:hypothetical protein
MRVAVLVMSIGSIVGCGGYRAPPRTMALPQALIRADTGQVAQVISQWEESEGRYRACYYRDENSRCSRAYRDTLAMISAKLREVAGAEPDAVREAWTMWRQAAGQVAGVLTARDFGKEYDRQLIRQEEEAHSSYCRLVPSDTATCPL